MRKAAIALSLILWPINLIGQVSVVTTATACPTCATSANNLSFFSATSSAQLRALITDENGTGAALFDGATSPTFVTPTIASFANATHNHQNAAGGGSLDGAAIGSGTVIDARLSANVALKNADNAFSAGQSITGNLGVNQTKSATVGVNILTGSSGDQQDMIQVTNTNASGVSAAALLRATADTATVSLAAHGTGRTTSRWGGAIGGWVEMFSGAGNGIEIGTTNAAPVKIGTNSVTAIQVDTSQKMSLPVEAITAGTMTTVGSSEAVSVDVTTCRGWTNAMVTALPTTAGDIAFGTLPAKTKLIDAAIIITGAAVGPTTVTVSLGRTATTYIDYIVASDAKATANTVYGDVSGERGTNLTMYDLPSYTGTTVINAHFVSTGANLSTVTGSTGTVCVTTRKVF